MPIKSDDIKLLKSAVMADVPEGGGQMTGVEVVDGESNNVYPDTSTDDRAGGRVQMRKLFGVAHTDDADSLLGASFCVLKPPADPNVHVAVFEGETWGDTRAEAQAVLERYYVKGSKYVSRIMDVHYAGALIINMYNLAPGEGFPEPGEHVVVLNPSGQEQYVRVLSTEITRDVLVSLDTSGVLTAINICACTLNNPLEFDVLGAPIQKLPPDSSTKASLYSTTSSTGVEFHGVKPLALPASIGDRSVTLDGGIFLPLVPSTTNPQPITDVYPLGERTTLSRTAVATFTLPSQTLTLSPGTVLQIPTAVEPATLTMTHGATSFTSNAAGELLQGATVVGAVDYRNRTITMSGSAPSYGSGSNTIAYKPATVVGATAHTMGREVTGANQLTAYVEALEPAPAPGTLTISYIAQGRWYTLADDGSGKVSGASSLYGSGQVSFVTGSVSLSLGALPDVDSAIIYTWGEEASARTATPRPTRAWAWIDLDEQPEPGTLAFSYDVPGGTASVTVAASGVVTGPAQVSAVELKDTGGYRVKFSPDVMPTGPITVTWTGNTEEVGFTNNGGGSYTLTNAPLLPGSVRFTLVASNGSDSRAYACHSVGTTLYAGGTVIGTVNNTTGALVLSGASSADITSSTKVLAGFTAGPIPSDNTAYTGPVPYYRTVTETTTLTFAKDAVVEFGYLPTTGGAADSTVVSPTWLIEVDVPVGLDLVTNGAAFNWAGQPHFTSSGVLYRGWNPVTGSGTSVGSVSTSGQFQLTSIPTGGANAITWSNLAQDQRGGVNVLGGVFRVPTAPISSGNFQLQAGSKVGSANSGDVITGDFDGIVDAARGIVYWAVEDLDKATGAGTPVRADELTYNAVYLQYVPIDEDLLGLSTARLPGDGLVPGYRAGGQVVVHNTLPTTLPNPLVKGTVYDLGRERISAVTVRTLAGVRVPGSLYTVDFDAGEIVFPTSSDLTGLDQPFTVEHRIEDELLVSKADISGVLDFAALGGLTHDYPAATSYVSSKLRKGDLYARAVVVAEQVSWTGVWSDSRIGDAITASVNEVDFPIVMTGRGAITERWALIFVSTTAVRIVGEKVGQVSASSTITGDIEVINPQTSPALYFKLPALMFGTGWSIGNVIRFNTYATGAAAWFVRTVLPGPAAVASDSATLAFRADVDAD